MNSFKASSFCNPSEIYNNPNNPFYQQRNYITNNRQLVIPSAQLENAFTVNETAVKKNLKRGSNDEASNPSNQFSISFDRIINSRDKRTTLMIRNIPNKYNISSLQEEINVFFEGKYDFLYLPLDYKVKFNLKKNNCNLGFAFINFVHPFHILLFHNVFLGKKWKKYNSVKVFYH
jgi:hypothetical protein